MIHPLQGSSTILRSIDIVGFKSFARPTRIELPSRITALVGPNGSGKSNIVDAVRWCLGEQSMRDIRGQRAEDVIYAGPRRVLGAAEVSLTFEGGQDSPDIAVTRRLYRAGDSEYLVNRERVRLRDMTSALRTLGVDGARSVIVNQGMADALLSATPGERRALLEHAAGLSEYRIRSDEARQKLTTTAQNVGLIETVLIELEPRLRNLRRQARAVQDREEAKRLLPARLGAWYAVRWTELTGSVTQLSGSLSEAEMRRDRLQDALEGLERSVVVEIEAEREWQAQHSTAMAALHAAQRDADSARFQLRESETRLSSIHSALLTIESRERRLREALAAAGERVDSLRSQWEAATSAVSAGDLTIGPLRKELEEAANLAHVASLNLEAARELRDDALNGMRKAERALTADNDLLSVHEVSVGDVESRIQDLEKEYRRASEAVVAAEKSLEQVRAASRVSDLDVERASTELRSRKDRSERLTRIRTRAERRASEATRDRVRAAAALHNLSQGSELAALKELVVPRGWERAVSAALRFRPAGRDDQPAVWEKCRIADFAAWRGALTPISVERGRWADEVVGGVRAMQMTPLIATVLAEDEEGARRIWRELAPLPAHRIGSPPIQVVTRDGTVFDALGRRDGGDDNRAEQYFRLRSDTEMLATAQDIRDRRVKLLEAEAARVAHACKETDSRLSAARASREKTRHDLTGADRSASDAARHLKALEREREELELRKQRSERICSELRSRTEHLTLAFEEQRLLLAQAGSTLEKAAAEAEAAGFRQRACLEALSRTEQQLELDRQKQTVAREALLSAQNDELRISTEAGAGSAEREELSSQKKVWDERVREAGAKLEELLAVQSGQADHLQSVDQAKPFSNEARRSQLPTVRAELHNAVRDFENLAARLEGTKESLDSLERDIWSDLGRAPTTLSASGGDVPDEDEIRRLRARAAQYADVDLSVVDEWNELDDRFRNLVAHRDDLQRAVEDLNAMVAICDREMRSRFARAFDAVNTEFARVFGLMLRGGSASLEVVDEEGGIGVRAQLPGRRLRSSAAFSGGERALVATSLLFGVLEIRPTPFCLLDEVDAALDETNVDRYLAALRDVSEKTQVIVVTHNRATMAAAEALYGVTMDDEGVSSLLSLRLEAYDAAG